MYHTYKRRSKFIRVEHSGAKNEMTSVQCAATQRQTVCRVSRNSQQQVHIQIHMCTCVGIVNTDECGRNEAVKSTPQVRKFSHAKG